MFGEKYQASGDYAVYFFHGNYDVPRKAKDKESLWESEEVYRFPDLRGMSGERDYEPGMPVCGFMFPAFKDRGPDNGRIQVFEADPARPHEDFCGPSSCECKIKEDGEEYFYEEVWWLKITGMRRNSE